MTIFYIVLLHFISDLCTILLSLTLLLCIELQLHLLRARFTDMALQAAFLEIKSLLLYETH